MTEKQSKTACLAIDVEKFGAQPSAHIVAIGLCLGDLAGNVLERRRWCVKPPLTAQMEPRCKMEFWDKFPGLAEGFIAEARPAVEVYAEVSAFLADVDRRFDQLFILSNNPAFDLGAIDVALERYQDRMPFRYTARDKYCWVADPSERAYVLSAEKEIEALAARRMGLEPGQIHQPDKDAEFIYHCAVIAQSCIVACRDVIRAAALAHLQTLT